MASTKKRRQIKGNYQDYTNDHMNGPLNDYKGFRSGQAIVSAATVSGPARLLPVYYLCPGSVNKLDSLEEARPEASRFQTRHLNSEWK